MANRNKAISIICFLFTACVLLFQVTHAENTVVPCEPVFITEAAKKGTTKSLKSKRRHGSLKKISRLGNKTFSKTKGVESYHEALVRELISLLGREPNSKQIEAIKKANLAGRGKGEITRIKEKTKILKEAGFSREETRLLMENGIVWIKKQNPGKLLIENLRKGNRKGKELYFAHKYNNTQQIGEIGRINKILKETNEAFLVEVDFLSLIYNTVTRQEVSISKSSYISKQLPPTFKILFEAAQSKRKIITLKDLKLPPPTYKEAELAKRGYGSVFTKALNLLIEWVAVLRRLQELRANPYTTHIEYFAIQIQKHIKYVKKEIILSGSTTKLNELKELEKEAKEGIKRKATYKWFLEINDKLAYLISNESTQLFYAGEFDWGENFLITLFPLKMMIPTIKGELGFMVFNRGQSRGIYPLGLIKETKKEGGRIMDPIFFTRHDMSHAIAEVTGNSSNKLDPSIIAVGDIFSSIGHYLFHKKIEESMESLPVKKGKQAELVYFQAMHESDGYDQIFPDIPHRDLRKKISEAVTIMISNYLTKGSFSKAIKLPDEIHEEQFSEILNSYVDAFMEVYEKAESY